MTMREKGRLAFPVDGELTRLLEDIRDALRGKDFNRRIEELLHSQPIPEQVEIVDLGTAHTDTPLPVWGSSLFAQKITGSLSVKFNARENPSHNLKRERSIEVDFYQLLLTNTAQTGQEAVLVIGKGAFRLLQVKEENLIVAMPGAAVNVTTSSAAVLAANDDRVYACLVNDSDTTIYLNFGAAAVLNSGIRLNASGGSYEITKDNLWKGIVYAIHGGTGNKVLTKVEGT